MDAEITRSHVTRETTALAILMLIILAGTVHIVVVEGSQVVNTLMPLPNVSSNAGAELRLSPTSIISNAVAVSVVTAGGIMIFAGPGPPMSLCSVKKAIIRGCGTSRKARAFQNLKHRFAYFNIAKMRVRVYSRFYIT